jgi:hypothetical protein
MRTASFDIDHKKRDRIMSDLLDLAIRAHGGLDRWRAIRTLDVEFSLTGRLWNIKGHPHGLRNVSLHMLAHQPVVALTPFAGSGRGGFTADRVWIEDAQGKILEERNAPRASFAGHTLMTPWDKLQELYFISYAMWNYLATPFLFAGPRFKTTELEPHIENGETWRRLLVTYPQDVPTHCAEQTFYFNDKGLLQRLDYVTDVAGGVASHYCFDHLTYGGIVFPTLRRVVPRSPASGPALSSATAVLLQITNINVA